MTSAALLAAVAGLGLGLSLIVAIGAQNAFVLRQGLRGEHVALVVAVCVASDAVLIVTGVAGAGAVLVAVPALITVIKLVGAAFLLTYGALAARRALRPGTASLEPEQRPEDPAGAGDSGGPPGGTAVATRRGPVPVLVTAVALTWLNPHVYLDTVVLLGSVAAGRGDQRWWFAGGAVLASALWFCLLGGGAAVLRPLFARPVAWRVLDGVIAVVMTVIGLGLLLA